MKKFLTIFALTATSFAADSTVNSDEMNLLWSTWKNSHSKNYEDVEESNRYNIFAENYNKILAHNAQNSTVTLGLNHFADLTGDEFKSQYGRGHISRNQTSSESRNLRSTTAKTVTIPATVDWRAKGAVTPIKNQLKCSGCWSFATTGALESLHFIKTKSLLSFSEQQLLDCDKNSDGCGGGNMLDALSYTAKHGIELESGYPFVQKTETCKYNSKKAMKVNKGHINVKPNNVDALMLAIVSQPVSVAVEADQSLFQFYKSGVVTSNCGSNVDHSVLAVGYTTVNGVKAFIIKNSWGTTWGEKGYVYISTSSTANKGKGVCGILTEPGYPTA